MNKKEHVHLHFQKWKKAVTFSVSSHGVACVREKKTAEKSTSLASPKRTVNLSHRAKIEKRTLSLNAHALSVVFATHIK